MKWRQDKKCSTCHHGTLTMWVQLEAKSRGFIVAPDELQENVRWAKERIMERADLPREGHQDQGAGSRGGRIKGPSDQGAIGSRRIKGPSIVT